MDAGVLSWLLEEAPPGVRVRALTGLCGVPEDDPQVAEARTLVLRTLDSARDLSWMEGKGLWLTYHLTALAEAGLRRADVPVGPLVERLLAGTYDAACGDMMMLRALVMLGYGDDPRVGERLAQVAATQMPDQELHQGRHARPAARRGDGKARPPLRRARCARRILPQAPALLPHR